MFFENSSFQNQYPRHKTEDPRLGEVGKLGGGRREFWILSLVF